MPLYDYRCGHCGQTATLRRAIDEMDDPAESLCCGAVMGRLFSVTSNIFVPIHFQAVREGGLAGGLSWSDFHDVSEKELAHLKDEHGRPVEVEPYSRAHSRSGTQNRAKKRKKKESANA